MSPIYNSHRVLQDWSVYTVNTRQQEELMYAHRKALIAVTIMISGSKAVASKACRLDGVEVCYLL
jgi:hypothetical protein